MNRKQLMSIIMVVVIALGIVAPALAAPLAAKKVDFKVVNKSDEVVTVKLTGPQSYEITVEEEDDKKIQIEEGEYLIEYTSCGDFYDATITIDDDFTMTIYACGIVPTKMRVKSHLPDDVVLEMNGPKSYDFDIELGQQKVELLSGNYVYSYEACDTTFTGEIRVTKNGKTELVMHSCEWYNSPVRIYGKPNPVKFRIANQASFPVDLYLIGPYTYYFKVYPGMNQYIVVSGSYEYGYFLDNTLYSGRIGVLKNGATILVVRPMHVYGIE